MMNMKIYRNSLDIDYKRFNTKTEDTVKHIVEKIKRLDCCAEINIKRSSGLNGFHITLTCLKDCDLCRLCYDDPERYARDRFRPSSSQNVLFNKKIIKKQQVQ